MKTLKFSNGDISIGVATGRPRYIEGLEKTSQDVAHTLLTKFDARRAIGSQLVDFDSTVTGGDLVPQAQAGFVRRYVEDAIRRLMAKQAVNRARIPDSEFIVDIRRIEIFAGTKPTDVYFYAEVITADSNVTQNAFRINLKHILPPGAAAFLPGTADDFTSTSLSNVLR